MPVVSPLLVALLRRLFADRHGELARALQRQEWAKGLMQKLPLHERTDPEPWFREFVQHVQLAKRQSALLDLLRELHPAQLADIDAVATELEQHGPGIPSASRLRPKRSKEETNAKATAQATPKYAAPRSPIRVLHLSDLHFSEKAAWDQMPVLTELVKEVKALRVELGPIHRVVITGDIANFGTAKEYAKAAAWLNGPLAEAAGVKADQMRMVPGNHDVDRSKVNLAVSGLDEKVLSKGGDDTIAKLMSDKALRKMLLDRQAAYRKFARGFNPQDDAPGWRSEEKIEGWAVHFIGLNTAWLSGSHKNDRGEVDDHRHLVLGDWQWNALFPADRPVADLTIALMHHPWEDLTEQASLAHREATYHRCGVILRGHLHRVDTLSAKRDKNIVLEAAAGACYADPREGWPHGFQLLELDPGVGRATIHLRKWHSDRRWIPDRERFPDTGANGIIEVELRRSTKAPPTLPDDNPTPVRTPRERYAALLQGQLDKLPDVFRVGGGPRTIEAVYVEVTLAAHERELDYGADAPHAQGRKVSGRFIGGVEDLHGRVSLTRVLAHSRRRWGLLGEPGGGKTTLLRHVAIELLKDTSGPLPIYLKVAELAQGLPTAITALCSSFAAADLAQFVLDEAQAGRAVLLIDGLDEAVDLPAARKWVAGAAQLVGQSQVIVASRPIGYTEPAADFNTLTLCPLGAEEQAELLSRWVRDAGRAASALERLSRTPRLRRLGENPLLLTLVGLLLRAGQEMPRRRGELYERALKLLLTRDHNAEDAAPVAPMKEPDLTLELLGWAALRLHGQEGEAYRRNNLITALETDARNASRLRKHWSSPAAFIAEVAERTGILIPDTGRVKDATAYSFPHRTFREFLAATALERDMRVTWATVLLKRKSELSRVFAECKVRPDRWSEVLALTCGRLGPSGANALLYRIYEEGNRPLILSVLVDIEGISAEAFRRCLNLARGFRQKELRARQKVIEEIPEFVKHLDVAVRLLEQVAKSTTCGHDLFWVREVLRRIERGDVASGVLEGSVEDAKRAAKRAADNVLSHLSTERRAQLLELLNPWWCEIPAGSFDMGSNEYDDERPIHSVTFTSGFQMLGVPVTWAMYLMFDPNHDAARSISSRLPPDAQDEVPVYNVSWFASVMFAEWVGARLPLEQEWEYACRAGTKTRFWSGDADEDLARAGWTDDAHDNGGNAQPQAHPVAQKAKNAWGLHDVHGEVWEWCLDEGGEYAARAEGLTVDPRGLTFIVGNSLPMSAASADHDASRVVRGGSWYDGPELARSASRFRCLPSHSFWSIGFRLVRLPSDQ